MTSVLTRPCRVVLFCSKHSLSPSVKAGGYGTAGWSIGGDIIIDVSKLNEIDIEIPKEDGSFTSLRDVAPANSKGKKSQAFSGTNSGKRRREDDANLRVYDSASHAVASFLRGPSFPAPNAVDGPSPSVRRRLEGPETSDTFSDTSSPRGLTRGSSSSSNSASGSNFREQSASTIGTTPSPPPVNSPVITSFPAVRPSGNTNASSNVIVAQPASNESNSSPFGYLEIPSNSPPAPPPTLYSNYHPSMTTSWSSGYDGSSFTNAPGSFGRMQIPAQAEPIYPHAYVTFGAGMRQKEIDTFTAKHKLEARYLTGDGDGIPYHVPL